MTVPADARLTAAHFRNAPPGRALRVRSGCAVRLAVPSDAVHRHVHSLGRGRADSRHPSDPGAIRRRHLQRREATRDPRRAGVCRDGHARRSSSCPTTATRGAQGRSRHGHESCERRGERGRDAGAATRLARDAGHATGSLHARRRIDDGAIHAAAAGRLGAGRGRDEARRQPVLGQGGGRHRRARPTPRATRWSSIRTRHAVTC